MKKIKWSNKLPTKSGYYWSVEKTYIDGELTYEYTPEIVFIDTNSWKKSMIISSCGSDDCDFVNKDKKIFDIESKRPRVLIFTWDSNETKERKIDDIVSTKYIRLISPIKMVKSPGTGEGEY